MKYNVEDRKVQFIYRELQCVAHETMGTAVLADHLYLFGSEIDTLRIYKAFHNKYKMTQGFSPNKNVWYVEVEIDS